MVTDITLNYYWVPRIYRAFRLLFTGKFTLSADMVRAIAASVYTMDADGEED